MNNAINITGLSHSFGKHQVLKDLNLKIPAGSIYGFLGRNGAGKTTCIRILAGLLGRQSGEVSVLGHDPLLWEAPLRENIGYVGEAGMLPGLMSVKSLIEWTRPLYPRWSGEIEEHLIAVFRINVKKKIGKLSLGQKMQVAFLLAVAPRPKLLLLDEPAANLDTVARRFFLEEIAALAREENTTVFFSSHVLSDVERVADHIGILVNGSLLVNEPLDELKESIRQVRFFWDQESSPPIDIPSAYRTCRESGETIITMRLSDEAQMRVLAEQVGCSWESRGLNLEDLFVELTEGESA
jgi:ABC-2 type transport system ATP-binding protein